MEASCIAQAMIRLGVPDPEEEANRRYQKYSQLCWAKHTFPAVELQLSIQKKGDQRIGIHGPNVSEDAVRASWFGLENGIWYAYVGMKSVIHSHLSDQVAKTVLDDIQRLVDEYSELANEFRKRWPPDDPFPGKWRDITKGKRSKKN